MGGEQIPWKGPTPEVILKRLAPSVIKYAHWYAEHGLHLPEQFNNDPAVWTEKLREVEFAFEYIRDGEKPTNDVDLGRYMRGIQTFYQYMNELWL